MRKVLQEIHGNPGKSESILGFLVHILMYATVCCVFFCIFFFGFQHLRWGAWGEVGMAANLDDASQRPWRFYVCVAKLRRLNVLE